MNEKKKIVCLENQNHKQMFEVWIEYDYLEDDFLFIYIFNLKAGMVISNSITRLDKWENVFYASAGREVALLYNKQVMTCIFKIFIILVKFVYKIIYMIFTIRNSIIAIL